MIDLTYEAVVAASENDNRTSQFEAFGAHISTKSPEACKNSVDALIEKYSRLLKNLKIFRKDLQVRVAANYSQDELTTQIEALQELLAAKQKVEN